MVSNVDLGFVETCEPWEVESYQFPSKVGGKPAWLSLEKLPKGEELQCELCNKPLVFLCQVYAPYEDDCKNFHRTIFIFICRDPKCCQSNRSENIKCYRSRLNRDNKFYSANPPENKQDEDFSLEKWVRLCRVCGCSGHQVCGKCKTASYCSKEHQILDWKEGHKSECGSKSNRKSSVLFPELIIEIEPEEFNEEPVNEAEELRKFHQLERTGGTGTLENISEKDLEMHASKDEDKTFSKFKERISNNPDQILRYERGGEPLWIAPNMKPETIPNCEHCGGPRQFEFQIMPQLLSIFKENEIDWGTIAIYTCKRSCESDKYNAEFVYKQDVL